MKSGCSWMLLAACGVALSSSPAAAEDVATFYFADVGTSYTGVFFPDNPLIGQEVVLTRIFLTVQSYPGSNAALFDADISFPIQPHPGNRNALSINGGDLGWWGAGTFTYMHETTEFNGVFVSTLFGAESASPGFNGEILEGSRIEMVVVPAPAGAAVLALAGIVAGTRRRR